METKPIGIYVHIPFCKRKCNYCDFCSVCADGDIMNRYTEALCDEISRFGARKKAPVNTVFFGGGTPSLLSGEAFLKIMNAIRESFEILPSAEITAEVNPGTVTEEKALFDIGFNRISIGLQSIHENELKILGRIHNFDEFADSYRLAREFGIDNINIDLMYGIPEQTMESFEKTLCRVLSLTPEHISLYGLILEVGTPLFNKKDEISFPPEDTECDMYYLAARMLSEAGYSHYEISNYARADKECRHNLKYWRCDEYIGVGLAAYSYLDGYRYGNTDVAAEYFNLDRTKYVTEVKLDNSDMAYEYVMLGFRLKEGISLSEYKRLFGIDFLVGREEKISSFIKAGYLAHSSDRLSLTESGFYVSNSIINELI